MIGKIVSEVNNQILSHWYDEGFVKSWPCGERGAPGSASASLAEAHNTNSLIRKPAHPQHASGTLALPGAPRCGDYNFWAGCGS